jgi:outer membrane protein assembly factor BamA
LAKFLGLVNLRKAYRNFGYINQTSFPNTKFDQSSDQIDLAVDIDEGKQFYVKSIDILTADEALRSKLLREFPIRPGQIYNRRLIKVFLQKHVSVLPSCPYKDPDHPERHLDERAGEGPAAM